MLTKICPHCIPEYSNPDGFGEPVHSPDCLAKRGNKKEAMLTFKEFIEDQEFVRLAGGYGEFYECPGAHTWHEDEVKKLYKEYVESPGVRKALGGNATP